MKLSITASLTLLATITSAAPARDHIRRDLNGLGHQVKAARQANIPPYPTGTAMPIFATGTGIPSSSAVSIPTATSTAITSCPVNGALVCNGPRQFGLCNFGAVVWQPVADGTVCEDGKIVGSGAYALPTATS